MLRRKQHRARVDIHRPVPTLDALFHHRTIVTRCRVVNQNVQSAEMILHFLEEPFEVIFFTHIGQYYQRFVARGGLDLFSRGLCGSTVAEKIDDDWLALGGKTQRNRLANAAPAAGDNGDLPLETIVHYDSGSVYLIGFNSDMSNSPIQFRLMSSSCARPA